MLPNLIIIGAMKSGTTSFHKYLGLHPDIAMSKLKECDFFVEQRNWKNGVAWYESQFSEPAMVRGETSPHYTNFPFMQGVPERMHSLLPDAKLIYLVRDPIERMISHYLHNVHGRHESRPVEEAFADPSRGYYFRSRYHTQIMQFLSYYDRSQIMIVSNEELGSARAETLAKVFRFLGVDDGFRSDVFESRSNVSAEFKRELTRSGRAAGRVAQWVRPLVPVNKELWATARDRARLWLSRQREKPVLGVAARERVAAHLAEDVAQFRAWTGRDFKEWSL